MKPRGERPFWKMRPWLRVAGALKTRGTWASVVKNYKNWPIYFLDLLGLLRFDQATFVLKKGARFVVRPNTLDRGILDEIWIRDAYLVDLARIPENGVVVDIGANIGAFCVLAALRARAGRVLCYEPHPENFRLLQRNIQLNHLHNVAAFPLGVAGMQGRYKLMGEGALATIQATPPASGTGLQVECTTLQGIFEQNAIARVTFLKCDCEGAEFEIFLKTPRDYLCRIDRISMEYHLRDGESSLTELLGTLESASFEVQVAGRGRLGMVYARNRSEGSPE